MHIKKTKFGWTFPLSSSIVCPNTGKLISDTERISEHEGHFYFPH